jgi:hypothetical protein
MKLDVAVDVPKSVGTGLYIFTEKAEQWFERNTTVFGYLLPVHSL